MIFIKVDDKGMVDFIHHTPFSEENGMGVTEKTLRSIGYLVPALPEVEVQEGKTHRYFYDGKEFRVEYIDKDVTIPEVIEMVRDLKRTRTEEFQSLDVSSASLEDVRFLKIESLKEQCTNAIYKGFHSTSLDKSFGFNDHDQANFVQQTLLYSVSNEMDAVEIEWKSLDGSLVKLTKATFMGLVQEAADHKYTQQRKYWNLESMVKTATTKEEIISVEW